MNRIFKFKNYFLKRIKKYFKKIFYDSNNRQHVKKKKLNILVAKICPKRMIDKYTTFSNFQTPS